MSTTPCTPVPCTPVPCTPFDPCTCAPGLDKEIIFNEASCLSADPRFLWDYTDGLLSIDGAVSASGYIGSSSQVEGAYLAPQALGMGALNFTPPAGYGGLVYRGGSVFFYWNNANNDWEQIDFAGEVVSSQINIAHNGVILGAVSEMNFQDSSTGTWTISATGNVFISLSNVWNSNINAANYSITNLYSINGIQVSNYLTNPLNQNVNGNNFSISGLNNLVTSAETVTGNLTVNGEIYYKGLPLESQLGSDLWTLNADGSISRSSNVYISGAWSGGFGPLTVNSTNVNNYLYLNATGAPAGDFCAFGAMFNNTYAGELGFSSTSVELWLASKLMYQGNSDGTGYISGPLGVNNSSPAYPLDVTGNVNSSGCFLITGIPFACLTPGGGGINLNNITNINGAPPGSGGGSAQTPWQSNINGNGFSLTGALNISALNGVSAAQNYSCGSGVFVRANATSGVDLVGIDSINGAPYPPTVGTGTPQTPWLTSINAASFPLYNLFSLAIGTPTPPATQGSINIQGNSGQTVIQMADSTPTGYIAFLLNTNNASAQIAVWGNNAGPNANYFTLANTAGPINFATTGTSRLFLSGTGNVGVSNMSPVYPLDVNGDINTNNCYRVAGVGFACATGTGTVNLNDIATINGATYISGTQPQTPWAQNINGAGFLLGFVGAMGIGPSTGAGTGGVIALSIAGSYSSHLIFGINNLQNSNCDIYFENNTSGATLQVGIPGTAMSTFPGQANINVSGGSATLIFSVSSSEVVRFKSGPRVGIGQSNPAYALDVVGGVNATGGFVCNGVPFVIWGPAANEVQLENVYSINGTSPVYDPLPHDVHATQVFGQVYGPFPQFRAVSLYIPNMPANSWARADLSGPGFTGSPAIAMVTAPTVAMGGSLFFFVPAGNSYLIEASGVTGAATWVEYYYG